MKIYKWQNFTIELDGKFLLKSKLTTLSHIYIEHSNYANMYRMLWFWHIRWNLCNQNCFIPFIHLYAYLGLFHVIERIRHNLMHSYGNLRQQWSQLLHCIFLYRAYNKRVSQLLTTQRSKPFQPLLDICIEKLRAFLSSQQNSPIDPMLLQYKQKTHVFQMLTVILLYICTMIAVWCMINVDYC